MTRRLCERFEGLAMFKKFVSIRNVARFRNYGAGGDVELKRNNLLFGIALMTTLPSEKRLNSRESAPTTPQSLSGISMLLRRPLTARIGRS
jgi:hypothetical protein